MPIAFLKLEEDARRAEDVAGIEKGGANPGGEIERLAVVRVASEEIERSERIDDGIERLAVGLPAAVPRRLPPSMPRILLLQVGGVEKHQPRKLARGGGGDDLAVEASLHEQRKAPAMVEMRMRQKHDVDGRGVEAEGLCVVLLDLAAALIETAIDKDLAAGTLDQVARAGDAAIGAVEGQFHDDLLRRLRALLTACDFNERASLPASCLARAWIKRRAAGAVPAQDAVPDLLAVSANQNSSRSSRSMTPSSTRNPISTARCQIALADEHDGDRLDLARLDQRQHLEQLVEGAVAAGKSDKRPGAQQEVQLAQREIVEVEASSGVT